MKWQHNGTANTGAGCELIAVDAGSFWGKGMGGCGAGGSSCGLDNCPPESMAARGYATFRIVKSLRLVQ